MIKLKKLVDNNYAYGIFEEESFKIKPNTKNLQIIDRNMENHPEATGEEDDSKTWNVVLFKVNLDLLDTILMEFKNKIWEGWYSVIWTDQKIFVIFSNEIVECVNLGSKFDPIVGNWNKLKKVCRFNSIDVTSLRNILPDYFKNDKIN